MTSRAPFLLAAALIAATSSLAAAQQAAAPATIATATTAPLAADLLTDIGQLELTSDTTSSTGTP